MEKVLSLIDSRMGIVSKLQSRECVTEADEIAYEYALSQLRKLRKEVENL